MLTSIHCLLPIILFACGEGNPQNNSGPALTETFEPLQNDAVILQILGTIQDAGSPQIACKKACCKGLFENPDPNRKVVSLGLVDKKENKQYLFEATPDLASQMERLSEIGNQEAMADGIFLTHAHIGHYTGLMYLGKEALDAKKKAVYAMPRMKIFLTNNGPWSLLVERENIEIFDLEPEVRLSLTKNISVTPFLVPHRDEFSETVGYHIQGPNKSALFIPDIDKWEKWEKDIVAEIKKVDYAFVDATFYSGEEINNRDISQIPHPFIIESMAKFKSLDPKEKEKIIFIHFNHTNPVIVPNSEAANYVRTKGYRIAEIGASFVL
jgi:pyrroloquinoline quinone biosynthesis protein B